MDAHESRVFPEPAYRHYSLAPPPWQHQPLDTCSSESDGGDSPGPEPEPKQHPSPYSIEAILAKSPTKRARPPALSVQSLLLVYPPCGLLLDRSCTCGLQTRHQ
ncbi:hypothetical protein J6590_022754 [Homalodisca vitripennis]|nr:hypothetical protein J6590_105432 [Homalodisca vitripennis]KAG8327331.1 hypothetical protein J6590_022754 [Homalodisca vitripennis]